MRTSAGVKFIPWDWNLALNDDVIILCGEGCAASLLSRAMGEWKEDSAKLAFAPLLATAA